MRGTAGAAAGAVLLWTASAAAGILRHSLNRVLGAPRARAFWHRKAIELTMVLVVGTLLSLSLLVSGITALVESVPALAAIARAVRQSPLAAAAARAGPWVLVAGLVERGVRPLPAGGHREGSYGEADR